MCEFCDDKEKMNAIKAIIGKDPDYCPVCGSTLVLARIIESIREHIRDSVELYAPKEFYNMKPEKQWAPDAKWFLWDDVDIAKECILIGVDLEEKPKE